jgi:hypothetical protein
MNCHICGQPSIGQCQSCWKFYCAEHGDLICAACNDDSEIKEPESVLTGRTNSEIERHQGVISVVVPTAELRVLRRVVAVGKSQTRASTNLTIASVELYDDGSRLVYSIRRPRFEESRSMLERSLMYGFPRTSWEVVDDQGREYKVVRSGGGGGGAEWRFEGILEPAISDDATRLVLTCSEIQFEASGVGIRSRTQPGPWRFEIPLT